MVRKQYPASLDDLNEAARVMVARIVEDEEFTESVDSYAAVPASPQPPTRTARKARKATPSAAITEAVNRAVKKAMGEPITEVVTAQQSGPAPTGQRRPPQPSAAPPRPGELGPSPQELAAVHDYLVSIIMMGDRTTEEAAEEEYLDRYGPDDPADHAAYYAQQEREIRADLTLAHGSSGEIPAMAANMVRELRARQQLRRDVDYRAARTALRPARNDWL